MASFLEAFHVHGPRLVYSRTATTVELAQLLAGRTGFKHGQMLMVLRELHEVLLQYGRSGVPVEVDGIGRFRPAIRRDGHIHMAIVVDRELATGLAALDRYVGEIANRVNIGLDDAGYKALWDAAHPEDPLDLPLQGAERAA